MSTVTFDTLEFVETLKQAGIPENQARAQSEALKKVLNSEVATKHDITEMGIKIEKRLNLIENRFGHMEKIMWAILGGVLGLIAKEVIIHTMRG